MSPFSASPAWNPPLGSADLAVGQVPTRDSARCMAEVVTFRSDCARAYSREQTSTAGVSTSTVYEHGVLVQVYCVASGHNQRTTAESPMGGWSGWINRGVPLFAPRATTPPPLEGLVSLTDSRWQEGGRTVRRLRSRPTSRETSIRPLSPVASGRPSGRFVADSPTADAQSRDGARRRSLTHRKKGLICMRSKCRTVFCL